MAAPFFPIITTSGAPVLGIYHFHDLFNLRPSYQHTTGLPFIWWGTQMYPRWIIGTCIDSYDTITTYYQGNMQSTDWIYELFQCSWVLGQHPDTALPLPILELWTPSPPLGPSSTNLLIEGLPNPTLVTNPTPDITWDYVPGDCPGDQAAFRILAATAPQLLEPGQPDLWDSGVHESNTTIATYAGQPLSDNQMVFYRVMVRDPDGIWSYP